MPRKAARRDKNEGEIVALFEAYGASVQRLDATNVPDLLVGYHGHNLLVEVKSRKGRLRDGQKAWISDWEGQVCVVRNIDEAQALLEGQFKQIGATKIE